MLVSLLIMVLVIGLVLYLLQQIPLGQPWKNVVTAIAIVIAIIYLLGWLPPVSHPVWK